jgi:hypothetical protein
MSAWSNAVAWMSSELVALETRLANLPRFAQSVPMVHDAIPARRVLELADHAIRRSRDRWMIGVGRFRAAVRIDHAERRSVRARYTSLRWRANAVLDAFDIFADAVAQRAEHGVGVLLKGLDVLARDGLQTQGDLFEPPPVVVFADRGSGGEVRRAFTKLPTGDLSAITMVRLPRERLCGVGLASLLHEVGHQGVALLQLLPAYRRVLEQAASRGLDRTSAAYWSSKLSELLPDLWACCKLGVAASLGLASVFSGMPRAIYFDRIEAPHPAPWLRVLASIAFGARVFPSAIWNDLRTRWLALYPLADAPQPRRSLLARLAGGIDEVIARIAEHAPRELGRTTLPDALGAARVDPVVLLPRLRNTLARIESLEPCRALAVLGLARQVGFVHPAAEHPLYCAVVARWASPATRRIS